MTDPVHPAIRDRKVSLLSPKRQRPGLDVRIERCVESGSEGLAGDCGVQWLTELRGGHAAAQLICREDNYDGPVALAQLAAHLHKFLRAEGVGGGRWLALAIPAYKRNCVMWTRLGGHRWPR